MPYFGISCIWSDDILIIAVFLSRLLFISMPPHRLALGPQKQRCGPDSRIGNQAHSCSCSPLRTLSRSSLIMIWLLIAPGGHQLLGPSELMPGSSVPCHVAFKALPRAHLNVSSRQCIVNTRMAVRRLLESLIDMGARSRQEVKRPHRITQYGSLGDERSTDGMTAAYTILLLSELAVHVVTQHSAHLSSRLYLMRMVSWSVCTGTHDALGCFHLIIEAVKPGSDPGCPL